MLRIFKIRKKRIVIYTSILLSTFGLLFLFNNMTTRTSNVSLPEILDEAKKLDAILSTSDLTDAGKGVLSLHRVRVSNLIILLTKAKNCSELASQDPQFLSAEYKFYNSDSPTYNLEKCTSTNEIMSIITNLLMDDN